MEQFTDRAAEDATPCDIGATEGMSAFCPRFHIAVEIVGRRWSGAILRAMLSGRTRYSDVAVCVPGLSDRLLSERLKEFEAEGILERRVIPETPVRIEYHLTDKGRDLELAFAELSRWAEKWVECDPERQGGLHDREALA
jgi:DNA-binding HxlR family transcriptional regulator